MNARSLINFFHHRCCNRAQWEIKEIADQMLELVLKVAPELFKNAGPACVSGGCPEGKMTCGKIKEVRGLGLMIGCELTGSAKDVNAELFKNGVLVNTIGEHVLRFVPPLTITREQIDDFIVILENALAE